MYLNYIFRGINQALPILAATVMNKGAIVGSRQGIRTRELTHTGITLTDPYQREILLAERKANIAAQIAETMWVLSGRNDIEFLSHYLPRAEQFSDDGKTWRGGYGPRIRSWGTDISIPSYPGVDQLSKVIELMSKDRKTRRAVIDIFNPSVDHLDGKDIPCNNWLSFLLRGNRLDLHVAVRSNDLIWGWSGINAFQWSVLQEIVAGMLDAEIGSLHFSITSLHVYENYWEKTERISNIAHIPEEVYDSPRFDMGEDLSIEYLDGLFQAWFQIEERIREGSDCQVEVDRFPEPMMQSWLRVLQWWWTGNNEYVIPLAKTRLGKAINVALQPPEREVRNSVPAPSPIHTKTSSFIEFAVKTHREKDAAYGDSWKKRGEMISIMANIARKIDRLGKSETSDETSADTAMDLMIYLAKYRVWIDDQILGRNRSDSPEEANANLVQIDSDMRSHMEQVAPGWYRENLESELRDLFDGLEESINTSLSFHERISWVDAMLSRSYRLARWLYGLSAPEQSWIDGNATRSWNPDA